MVKSYVHITHRVETKADLDFIASLYTANKFNVENRRMLSRFVRWNLIITKILTGSFFAAAVCLLTVPFAIFLISGKMEPIIPTHIPLVPTDQLWGYAIHNVYFICCIATAYAGQVENDTFLLTMTLHIWPMYKILDQAIIGLNQAVGSLRKEDIKNSSWLHFRVRNIALMHKRIYL